MLKVLLRLLLCTKKTFLGFQSQQAEFDSCMLQANDHNGWLLCTKAHKSGLNVFLLYQTKQVPIYHPIWMHPGSSCLKHFFSDGSIQKSGVGLHISGRIYPQKSLHEVLSQRVQFNLKFTFYLFFFKTYFLLQFPHKRIPLLTDYNTYSDAWNLFMPLGKLVGDKYRWDRTY